MLEPKEKSRQYREAYRDGIRDLIHRMQENGRLERTQWMPPCKAKEEQEAYREELRRLLGWPLTQPLSGAAPQMTVKETIRLENHRLLRVQFEVFPGLPYYGLLYVPEHASQPLPLIICQHGGQGTPELCSDFHGNNNYSHIVTNLLKTDAVVFAPQMLLWCEAEEDKPCFPGYGLPYNRNETDAALRQLGGSLAALEVFCLMRALDTLCLMEEIDAQRIAMLGLSYGGFYTQLTAALDTRIRCAHSSAFFSQRESYCWPDFAWQNAARRMQDAEICALIAPRPLTIEIGTMDNRFDYRLTRQEFERLVPYYEAHGAADRLRLQIVQTNHQYGDVEGIINWLMDGMKDG